MPETNAAALAFLAARQTYPQKVMTGEVPARAELESILTTALRVPDHGKLEPWRLIVLEKADLEKLALMVDDHAATIGADAAKGRGQYATGHLAVAVIYSPKGADRIPLSEQHLSAGALCMNIHNAASAAGWGANWLSGWPSLDPVFIARAFGCTEGEEVAGIIHIGSRGNPAPDRPRPDLAKIVRWGL